MALLRQFKEKSKEQGPEERIAYWFSTVPWNIPAGDTPTTPVVVLKLNGVDVSADHLVGLPTIVANIFTTPIVELLERGNRYRLECKWTYSGNTLEAFGDLPVSEE